MDNFASSIVHFLVSPVAKPECFVATTEDVTSWSFCRRAQASWIRVVVAAGHNSSSMARLEYAGCLIRERKSRAPSLLLQDSTVREKKKLVQWELRTRLHRTRTKQGKVVRLLEQKEDSPRSFHPKRRGQIAGTRSASSWVLGSGLCHSGRMC